MTDFPALLKKFVEAVEANDGKGLAALFTPQGTYADYFFGPYTGAQAIAGMLKHFHDDARDYQWTFHDPVCDGRIGYARYTFSYVSTMPDAEGKAVVFEGMGCFKLEDGRIKHYSEVFDRGVALAQLDFAPERMKKSLARFAKKLHAGPEAAPHVERVRKLGATTLG